MKERFRKLALVALVLAAFGQITNAADRLNFFVIGDTGTGLEQQRQVAGAMAGRIAADGAAKPVNFILMVGDNFYDKGVTTVDDPQWQEKFEKMYDPAKFPMPFFVVLGNHDWRNALPDVEIEYAHAHPGTRWQMDGHFYKRSFPAGEDPNAPPLAEFFLIDTEAWSTNLPYVAKYPDKHLGEKQLAWLEDQLSQSRARWKIVAAHHPLYSNGDHADDAQLVDLRKMLGPIFKKRKVDAFITGHDHNLQRIEVTGEPTLFLISGAGAKLAAKNSRKYKPFSENIAGFAEIELTNDEMRGHFIGVDGKVLDEWHRTPLAK